MPSSSRLADEVGEAVTVFAVVGVEGRAPLRPKERKEQGLACGHQFERQRWLAPGGRRETLEEGGLGGN